MTSTITAEYLKDHPDHVFVFGDNLLRQGYGGAAALRDMENTYGFITKLHPSSDDGSYFTPRSYVPVYMDQLCQLIEVVRANPQNTYLISKLGAGLANRFHIWEEVIQPTIKILLAPYDNVEFLW